MRAAETLVSSFNKREELFNIPVTDYSELDLIRQDFEPYAALWNMAFVFQSSHSAWLTGNFVDLDGAKMEVSVQQWCVLCSRIMRIHILFYAGSRFQCGMFVLASVLVLLSCRCMTTNSHWFLPPAICLDSYNLFPRQVHGHRQA